MIMSNNLCNKCESSNESSQIVIPENAEQLQAKIQQVVETIINFSKVEKETYRNVTQQILEIIRDAERLRIGREELRRMLNEGFNAKGPRAAKISESYLRRLLPPEYKYSCKARLDYSTRPEVEERKSDKITIYSPSLPQQQAVNTTIIEGNTSEELKPEHEDLEQHKVVIRQQREAIKVLRKELARLEEQDDVWTANGTVQFGEIKLLLIITVDSKQRKIVGVELDFNDYSIDNEGMNNTVE